MAFVSWASNLVPGDTNGTEDVFVRDLQTGAITRVSTDANGDQGYGAGHHGAGGAPTSPSISADGRYVAFNSSAYNLVPGDTNGTEDVFVRDLQTGAITRVSTGANGDQGFGASTCPTISADGRYVAFVSPTSIFNVPGGNGSYDVFVRDLQTGAITRVSADAKYQANQYAHPVISADGRFVAFDSWAAEPPGMSRGFDKRKLCRQSSSRREQHGRDDSYGDRPGRRSDRDLLDQWRGGRGQIHHRCYDRRAFDSHRADADEPGRRVAPAVGLDEAARPGAAPKQWMAVSGPCRPTRTAAGPFVTRNLFP